MTMQDIAAPRSGWQTALDVLVAPKAAFAELREAPTWVWAFAISSVVGMICAWAISPAFAHALGVELPARLAASPQLAQLPEAQRAALIAQQVRIAQTITHYTFIFVPVGVALGCALQAVVMLVANAIGKGDGTFKRFWALAVNAALTGSALSAVALLLIVLVRGVDSFSSSSEIASALPGLGMLVPAGSKAAAAFFGVMNVFALWNMTLLALGMPIVARVPRSIAIVTAALLLAGTGLFPLIGVSFQK